MGAFEEIIERKKKGSLKVYLGYAAGVGKTYEMLQEAHRLKNRGFDVVIGYLEPHDRPETSAQASDIEMVHRKTISVGGRDFPELDLESILKRKPQVVLIDEFAHTNVQGSKNEKRYQDVFEILDHKINVITTLNIQHLESVADRVEVATGVQIQERIPDQVIRKADQVVLVDVSMEELRERLRMGKIYEKPKAESALVNFFTHQNLAFLREVALREVAGDQVRKIEEQSLLSKSVATLAEENVMVSLSSDPTNAEILLRKATRLANQLSSKCFAIYVQTKAEDPLSIDAGLQRKLQNNLKLAKTLGAEVITLHGNHIAEVLVNFAIQHQVRHAVFGKSRRTYLTERVKGSVVAEFMHESLGVDVHIVTTTGEKLVYGDSSHASVPST
jgi:two-component system sensor histidine kinase KdpD